MNFIKVTNASNGHLDDPLYINIDWIAAVYPQRLPDGGERTLIFGGPSNQTWHVEQGFETVIKLINEAKSSKLCSCK